ncbi:MAG: hypothetical protein ACKESB_00970 [Candidatus Hodgkinia cicadicola]
MRFSWRRRQAAASEALNTNLSVSADRWAVSFKSLKVVSLITFDMKLRERLGEKRKTSG